MQDSELIQTIRGGNREAFGQLVERYQGLIFQLCYRMTGNIPDAEELAHEAFVEAYVKLHQLTDPSRFAHWLKTLALNLCRMWYRQRKREASPLPPELTAGPAEEDRPAYTRVYHGLSRLSAAHRMMLVLHYWEGLSYEEVARFLDIPAGTVMSRLYRARHELKRLMQEAAEREEMERMPEEEFKAEVETEISVLLSMSGDRPEAMERLSVILRRSPERFAQLIQQAEDEGTLDDLALLLRRLGQPAIDATLACYQATDPQLRSKAARLLTQSFAFENSGRSGKLSANTARRGAYLILDRLIQASMSPAAKAELLIQLIGACGDEPALLLLANVLLCYPDEAFPRLLERFWQADMPADLHQAVFSDVLYALGRTGTRFAEALLAPLRDGDARQRALALEGAAALARALNRDWLDPENEERAALDARFRRKWAPPLPKDRDPAVLQTMADWVSELLRDDRAAVRDKAIHVLGLLGATAYRPWIRDCVQHAALSTRTTALRTLGTLEDSDAADLLCQVAREGVPAERRGAVEALGRLKVKQAQPLITDSIRDPDPSVRRAAIFALGEVGGEEARATLQELQRSSDKTIQEAVARALYAGSRKAPPRPDAPPRMAERIRGGAVPSFYISVTAAIRALPANQPYEEGELTRLIATVCYDFASTRRFLVEEGLMTRETGIFRFTERGESIWRVERFIRNHYMRGGSW
jgi:RNA polymerase sigma-70 factor (ECF subfamily)